MPDETSVCQEDLWSARTRPAVWRYRACVWIERVLHGTATSDEEVEERVMELIAQEVPATNYRVVRIAQDREEIEWS